MKWKTLLVDDEAHCRKHLRRLLEAHHTCEIVDEADSVASAVKSCSTHNPDLIFLDVQMPRGDGFALLPLLPEPSPRIVFVTAHEIHAVRAFEVNAADYLLKPVSESRLAKAMQRLASAEPDPMQTRAHATFAERDLVKLHDGRRCRYVQAAEIAAVEADGNFSRVYISGGESFYLSIPIARWEAQLPATVFLRVDRSLLINVPSIESFDRASRNEGVLHLRGLATPVVLGRTAASRLAEALRKK